MRSSVFVCVCVCACVCAYVCACWGGRGRWHAPVCVLVRVSMCGWVWGESGGGHVRECELSLQSLDPSHESKSRNV